MVPYQLPNEYPQQMGLASGSEFNSNLMQQNSQQELYQQMAQQKRFFSAFASNAERLDMISRLSSPLRYNLLILIRISGKALRYFSFWQTNFAIQCYKKDPRLNEISYLERVREEKELYQYPQHTLI